jgi:GGDEF domain-containing protein
VDRWHSVGTGTFGYPSDPNRRMAPRGTGSHDASPGMTMSQGAQAVPLEPTSTVRAVGEERQTPMQDGGIPEPQGWQDALTGVEGPEYWSRILDEEHARALRYRRPMTIVIVELAGIHELIDTWGADVARIAVREAGQCLRRSSRSSDHCARIGPARFGIVLTETNEIAAINFVERVRESGPGLMPNTGSGLAFAFGWASPRLGESPQALVGRAVGRLADEAANRGPEASDTHLERVGEPVGTPGHPATD